MKVEVYKNLHNGKWSIRDAKSKLILGHATLVELEHCKLKVSEAGRQRVLREKKKNVHAVVQGTLTFMMGFRPYKGRDVVPFQVTEVSDIIWHNKPIDKYTLSYNPYKGASFVAVSKATGTTTDIKVARFVLLGDQNGERFVIPYEEQLDLFA